MKTVKRTLYYCDHCGRRSFFRNSMEKHEAGCTLNPARVCRMHRFMDGATAPSMEALIAALTAGGFDGLVKASDGCPACILAAIRQAPDAGLKYERAPWSPFEGDRTWPVEDGRHEWDFKKATAQFWNDYGREPDYGVY
ncbi:MAG TPA: hypothetical protein VGE22_16725 [Solimonas sp.]